MNTHLNVIVLQANNPQVTRQYLTDILGFEVAQEHPGMPDHADLGVGILKTPFKIEDGYIRIPEGPGLGIEVDESKLDALRFDGTWDTPHLEFEDGSIADW